jgi:hypothetical protein
MTQQEYGDLKAKNFLLRRALSTLRELAEAEQKEVTHDKQISQYYKSAIETLSCELKGNEVRAWRYETIGK